MFCRCAVFFRPSSALFARTFSGADNLIRERVELPGQGVALWTVRGEGPAKLVDEVGLPLLCLCGALGTAETDFGPQLAGLSDERTVVSFDPRGYGASRPPVRDFSDTGFWRQDAQDGVALMAALGHERYHVCGWSDGAISAVILAADDAIAAAGHVDRLAIWGGNCYISEDDMAYYEAVRDVSRWSKRMRASLEPVYGGAEGLQDMWDAWYGALATLYEEGGGEICTAEAATVAAKTLILHGQRDTMVPEFHADYLHERIVHSRLELLPEGKHNLHLRYAAEVNALLRAFLTEPDDAATTSREFVSVPGFDATGKIDGKQGSGGGRPRGPMC